MGNEAACCTQDQHEKDAININSARFKQNTERKKLFTNTVTADIPDSKRRILKDKLKAEVQAEDLEIFEESWNDGAKYNGEHSDDGRRHGEGTFIWKNGDSYQGFFRQNNIDGYGTFTWSDGRVYKGEWKANKFHGVNYK